MAILLGLMCKHSCEDCLLTAYGVNNQRVIELEKGTILDNIKSVVAYAQVNQTRVGVSMLLSEFCNYKK